MTMQTAMNKQAAELILGLSGDYTVPELRTAFRRALAASPDDQSVYDAYSFLMAELGADEAGNTAAQTAFNPEMAAAAVGSMKEAMNGSGKYAKYEEPAPADAPEWYKFTRKALQHLPYRLLFLALAVAMYCGYAANPVGAMACIGHITFAVLAIINLAVPFITNPIRRLAIKVNEMVYHLVSRNGSVGTGGTLSRR